MLAAGNLPAFAATVDTNYVIYTPLEDRTRMERSALFEKLRSIVRIEFRELGPADNTTPIDTTNRIWQLGIREAAQSSAFVMFMPPDVVWADGSLGHLADLITAGKHAIFLNWHLRSISETFIPAFHSKHRPDSNGIVTVDARTLVQLGMEHAHPIVGAYLRDSPFFPRHPEVIFWPIPGEGVLMHVLALTPFVFRPDALQLTPTHLLAAVPAPDRLHFVSDSDDLYMVSLAELGKDADWYRQNVKLNSSRIARWWLYYDSPSNDILVRVPYRLHFTGMTQSKWRRAELAARLTIHRLISAREVLRLVVAAREMGCDLAAQLLEFVLHADLAHRIVDSPGPYLFLLPRDEAIAPMWKDVDGYLTSYIDLFLDVLRAHCVSVDQIPVLREDYRQFEVESAAGDTIALRIAASLTLDDEADEELEVEKKGPQSFGTHHVIAVKTVRKPQMPKVVVPKIPLDDPAQATITLAQACARGAAQEVGDELCESVRYVGLAGALTTRMINDLGWTLDDYRGFDHLPQSVRATQLDGDYWQWHRAALQLDLPDACAFKLRLDLVNDPIDGMRAAEVADMPVEFRALVAGDQLRVAGRHTMAAHQYAKALRPRTFLAPALRSLGVARWRSGQGAQGARVLDAYLGIRDGDIIDARAVFGEPRTQHLTTYQGHDIFTGRYFFYAPAVNESLPIPEIERDNIRSFLSAKLLCLLLTKSGYIWVRDVIYGSMVLQWMVKRRSAVPMDQSLEALLMRFDSKPGGSSRPPMA
jgi:hypothetical protein